MALSLMRRDPFRDLTRLHDEIDQMFTKFFGEGIALAPLASGAWGPSIDMYEKDGNLIIEADLPGIKKENVDLTISQDTLTIKGGTDEEKEEKREGYYFRERRKGQFLRSIPLPSTVDAGKARATFSDGTLIVTLPKMEEPSTSKKIPVT